MAPPEAIVGAIPKPLLYIFNMNIFLHFLFEIYIFVCKFSKNSYFLFEMYTLEVIVII
jgi:hypothetical protein